MNTRPDEKPRLHIRAKHIGPIMELNAELSNRPQHLIFARNGTGKSFIARALRLLDSTGNESEVEEEIPAILVSEESTSHQGHFSLFEGQNCIGSIDLNARTKTVNRSEPAYIYHVFSEDFIETHVRNRLHGLDGNITREIIVGKENADIDRKRSELEGKVNTLSLKRKSLDESFERDKEKLKSNFGIVASLRGYRQLSTDTYFKDQEYTPPGTTPNLTTLLQQYNTYKSLPSDPQLPTEANYNEILPNADELSRILKKTTSPSSVATQFKDRIQRDPSFFERGIKLASDKDADCPFCTQPLNQTAREAIEAYIRFFEDAESDHRRQLNSFLNQLEQDAADIGRKRTSSLEALLHFNELKKYFPSLSKTSANDLTGQLDQVLEIIENARTLIGEKLNNLATEVNYTPVGIESLREAISTAADSNREIYRDISSLASNSKNERLNIQNSSCTSLLADFYKANNTAITELRNLQVDISTLTAELASLQMSHGEKTPAKARVVETFKLLLRHFFSDAYTFDENTFSVSRRNNAIPRGPDRTLSDGEKSVIAFCYYIARIHLRVESLEDYKKFFLIVDDPVSSLSFDYVYGIAQCLKYLRISNDGEIQLSLEPQLLRPRMLVLTHNHHFYNVISTNNVVKGDGLFQLLRGDPNHELKNQKSFATPHVLQLRDIYEVSKRRKAPDHTTPNSIRSVIEGMWKFCRPDIRDFESFVKCLISDHTIEIKSVLLNDLCHGGKFSDPPHQEAEIIEAAVEALRVVETFAHGQLKLCE